MALSAISLVVVAAAVTQVTGASALLRRLALLVAVTDGEVRPPAESPPPSNR